MNKHVEDSYKVTYVCDIFDRVFEYWKNGELGTKRDIFSYVKEWHAHNILYKLHLFRKHTKDVDLNENEGKFRLFCYGVIWKFTRKKWKREDK